MKNAGMAGAVALVGIGLLSIGLSNFANRAEAVPSAVVTAGPDEPVIVWLGQSPVLNDTVYSRLWSDGSMEVRVIGISSTENYLGNCNPLVLNSVYGCSGTLPAYTRDTGWLTLPNPPGGDGFACRTDINGDRTVNAADLGLLIAQWGEGVSCDPQPTYPCFDLGNLSIAAAK